MRADYLYKEYFVKIYDSLNEPINGVELKQSDKLLFSFIYHAGVINRSNAPWNKTECNWSNSTLANNTGLTVREIQYSLKRLEKAGVIKRKNKKNSKKIEVIGTPYEDDTFIKMYTKVSRNKEFTLNDKYVYTVIHHLCENPKYTGCLATNTKIAERVNCSLPTVANSIKHL